MCQPYRYEVIHLLINIDVHTHSIASGHGSAATIADMARAAAARQLKALCITDHGPSTVGSAKESYFRGLKSVPRRRFGVQLYLGCEVNISDFTGHLDLNNEILSALDFNIASLHPQNIRPGTAVQNTSALIRAMENPYIHLIGHPDDEKYPLDYKALAEAARATHTLLELNRASLAPGGYRGDARSKDVLLLHWCAIFNQPVVLGSDSHGVDNIGNFRECLELIREVEFPEELVLNRNVDEMFRYCEAKK